ncbi:hypothetical protein LUZ63_000600 [Rhynchospora breviuscula]|uniref:Gnk2-homologous domain-containing protein n=1 Tax=Rhynchospora breviuscula TaxID=2022672 RepID=A0A9Q0CVB8_9POAL|nr:hypothetical protein LUZ63_000600 [Rhynchospora breviuscula]
MFSSLKQNTPKIEFSSAVKGKPPKRVYVYGLALCCSDITSDDCASCLRTASQHLLLRCLYSDGRIVWYHHCAVRYLIHTFTTQLGKVNDYFATCLQGGVANPCVYQKQLITLLKTISEIAAFNVSVRMFATGVNAHM